MMFSVTQLYKHTKKHLITHLKWVYGMWITSQQNDMFVQDTDHKPK